MWAALDLVLLVGWVVIVAGAPTIASYRATGRTPGRATSRVGEAQWWARLCSSVGFGLAVAAPLAQLAGLPASTPLDQPAIHLAGVGLVVAGTAGTLVAQATMGSSWRGDVDPAARTPLITMGPFRVVRNPILACAVVVQIGLALIVPNVVSAAMLIACVLAIEIQVRLVEEPYLERVHGDAYRAYAARTGRFVPGVGRLT